MLDPVLRVVFFSFSFSKVIQIDEVSEFALSGNNVSVVDGNALRSDVLDRVQYPIDFGICIAGFHHVLALNNGEINGKDTRKIRTVSLEKWKTLLNKNGVLLIADVPAPGDECTIKTASQELQFNNAVIPDPYITPINRACNSFECEMINNSSGRSQKASTYFDQLTTRLNAFSLQKPEPAHFFNSFVSQQSQVGHCAYFQSSSSLAHCFKEAGFADVQSFVCPTPWFFTSRKNAVWFIHELFAIGNTVATTPDDVSAENTALITKGIEQHLGFIDFSDGSCAILWKLMYVWGAAS